MTETQVEYAGVIQSSGLDLLELLNSILDLAKVESGTVTPELADVSIGELRTALLREFEHVAQDKAVEYSVDLGHGAPDSIVTDLHRLRQILKNLLANAFKFTERGKVHVQVGVVATGWSVDVAQLAEASAVLAIAVSDTGHRNRAGAAAADLRGVRPGRRHDRAHLRWHRPRPLDQPRARQRCSAASSPSAARPARAAPSPSTCRSGGPTAVAPVIPRSGAPGAGCRAKRHGQPFPRGSNGREQSPIDGVKILVVDDDIRNIFALTALLERGHADVTIVESGAEALAALEARPDIDIVLMDIMMPVMDGYDTIRAIRAIELFAALPIIAVTGKATAGERQRCIDAGANDYVPKPVDTAELIAALEAMAADPASERLGRCRPCSRALRRSRRSGRVGRGAHRPGDRHDEVDDDEIAIDGLKILVVDDDFRNIFAMTALLERGQADVVVAESGAEALAALERTPDVDIVLMDIMMPVMDGYDTIRAIREIDRFAALPIIAVTGKATAGERQRCTRRGRERLHPEAGRHGRAAGCAPALAARPQRSRPHDGAPPARRASDISEPSRTTSDVPILIVDDNAAKRLASKSVLLPLGYSIVEADSGSQRCAASWRKTSPSSSSTSGCRSWTASRPPPTSASAASRR